MKIAERIGHSTRLTLAGVAMNCAALWALAIVAKAGWFVYGLLLVHNTITIWQLYAMLASRKEFT